MVEFFGLPQNFKNKHINPPQQVEYEENLAELWYDQNFPLLRINVQRVSSPDPAWIIKTNSSPTSFTFSENRCDFPSFLKTPKHWNYLEIARNPRTSCFPSSFLTVARQSVKLNFSGFLIFSPSSLAGHSKLNTFSCWHPTPSSYVSANDKSMKISLKKFDRNHVRNL